ncbi:DUF1217 domain-containing protein [Belnapia moabensis]|uniref:DUF1217 domain-containing protein n=1 Tax=Belnapia moabensis TaxID=365533 RepID=UPI0005BA0C44|nr:DUF1217 domain-containing protein [Belnapia moabensis]
MTIGSAFGSSVPLAIPAGSAGWRLLQAKAPADFVSFSKDPMLKNDVAYLRAKLPTKLTAKDMLADPRLQRIVLSAYRLDAQVGMNGLMEKVLNSDTANSTSLARRMSNAQFVEIARDFNYGGVSVPAIPAMPAGATVRIEGVRPDQAFDSVSGSFGGVAVKDVDTSQAINRAELAAVLQAAWRRADGNRADISVTAFGLDLVFSDAKGRGAAKDFAFVSDGAATAALVQTTAGRAATAAVGGPKVTSESFMEQLITRFTEARFEQRVGDTSDTLRRALYAKRMLPQAANWYSVIADRNLAAVVESVLNLPETFVKVDVDRQVGILKSKMDIADFKDPKKLGQMLDRYVAKSGAAEGTLSAAASAMTQLFAPLDLSNQNAFSGASSAALFALL